MKLPETHDEVRSAVEIALKRAAAIEDQPVEVETPDGPVSMTFEEIKAKAALADAYLNEMKYKQAEFENYRKRTAREKEELLQEMIPVRDLVEILDHLDRALTSEGDAVSIREGVRIIRGQLWSLLEKRGLERIPGEGSPFDPNHHEAIAHQPHDTAPQGTVVVEYQSGFKLGERVIRPTKVVVSAGPAALAP